MMKNQEKQINDIDSQIIDLVKQRVLIVRNNPQNINFYNFDQLIDGKDTQTDKLIIEFLTKLNNASQTEILKKILYLGPEGSYTQDAAFKKFGFSNKLISVNSITNIFEELNKNNADFAVIPIENSLNGLVNDTINAFLKYDLFAVDEIIIDIHHTFASNCISTSEIKRIYSKDIAFDQCSLFLEKYNLHNIEHIYVESTTKAALLASQDKESAAICPKAAAIRNNVTIMFNDIEDDSSNKTRFFVLSKEEYKKQEHIEYKTSFLIQLPNIAGSLIDFLQIFKEENINLYKIKSHITKGISNFFIEFDGHKDDKTMQRILNKYNEVKIIGSYFKEVEDI